MKCRVHMEYNSNKEQPVLFCESDESGQGFGGTTGLSGNRILVIQGFADKAVMVCQGSCNVFVGGWNRVGAGSGNFSKFRVADCFPANQSHIIGTCIVFRLVQSVRVDKIAVYTAKFFDPRIHQRGKLLH